MKARKARFICVLLIAWTPVAVAVLVAQDSDEASVRSKIIALEQVWNQAEAFKDLKALDSLFDSALVYVDSDGTLMTKAEFLSHVKSNRLQQVVTMSMTVQVSGDTAIATGIYQANELKNGKPTLQRGRFIDTWVKRDGTWVCIAAQATPILH
jgi:ketosteroid isomerase-like protein